MAEKQTVLITGATGSIGGGAAIALAKRGARVVLLGRSQDRLSAKLASIHIAVSEDQGSGSRDIDIDTLVIDFSDMESVRRAADEARNRFPTINGLVLSVGTLKQDGPTVLPSGHEFMFASNVMGPFLFTNLLIEQLQQSDGLVLHVIAPFGKAIDWDDLESIENHKPMVAFDRTKLCNRVIAAELARRFAGKISSVAFDPTFVIDKTDSTLSERWPARFTGLIWRVMTRFRAKPPAVAGEPIADLMLEHRDRNALNGALYVLGERSEKLDAAMEDEVLGERLWIALEKLTNEEQTANAPAYQLTGYS